MSMGEVMVARESSANPINALGGAARDFRLEGNENAKFTDNAKDFYLPPSVHEKLKGIDIQTYNELRDYFGKMGLSLSTEEEQLEKEYAAVPLPTIRKMGAQLIAAVETFKETFGKDALKSLKGFVLFAKNVPGQASYTAILNGEEPNGREGYIRIRDFHTSGHNIFHEFTHAFQDSVKKKGEDILGSSERLNKAAGILPRQKAYMFHIEAHREAERMAEAVADGFCLGDKDGIEFIKRLRKAVRRK